jgi:hypothetical protein
MKVLRSYIFWGVLLVIGGIALLFESLNIFPVGGLIWGIILGIGGVAFLLVYFENHSHWWAIIPGVTLLSLSLNASLDAMVPSTDEWVGDVIVLGGIGLSFFLVYLVNRENWWAIIPAGVLVALGAVSIVEAGNFEADTGGIFFFGTAFTFLFVAILPTPNGQMKWAFIPAGIMAGLGAMISKDKLDILVYVGPVLLIIGGGYLVYKTMKSSQK